MATQIVAGKGFDHRVFTQHTLPNDSLHIYIEGDGSPWIGGNTVAADPTPRNPLALRLMAKSPYNSVYIGRPCYFDQITTKLCEPRYWTSARYSEAVVNSMLAVIERLRLQGQRLVLIGYSGGATLATLLTERLDGDLVLITVAGNLDIDRWTSHHGYLPLHESLNPAKTVSLKGVRHVHLAAEHDRVIPKEQIKSFAKSHGGEFQVFESYNHRCCWLEHWPDLLKTLLAEDKYFPQTTSASDKHWVRQSIVSQHHVPKAAAVGSQE